MFNQLTKEELETLANFVGRKWEYWDDKQLHMQCKKKRTKDSITWEEFEPDISFKQYLEIWNKLNKKQKRKLIEGESYQYSLDNIETILNDKITTLKKIVLLINENDISEEYIEEFSDKIGLMCKHWEDESSPSINPNASVGFALDDNTNIIVDWCWSNTKETENHKVEIKLEKEVGKYTYTKETFAIQLRGKSSSSNTYSDVLSHESILKFIGHCLKYDFS